VLELKPAGNDRSIFRIQGIIAKLVRQR
jgi:hypothetical protein